MAKLVALILLFCVCDMTLGGNINIDGSCPVNGYSCLQCLSRGSADLDRCQQLYFFVTYTNMNNEVEIERYCSGDCPILLATAQYYCRAASSIQSLFQVCPGYSVVPSGSFNVNANYSKQNCLDGNSLRTTKCSHCVGEGTREAVRCLQTYLLAQYSNNTSSYIEGYCTSNCPITLWSSSWYCGLGDQSKAYEICQKFGASYCLEFEQQPGNELSNAVGSCQSSCTNSACTTAQTKFGCCLKRYSIVAFRCSDILECSVAAPGATPNTITFNRKCPFNAHSCQQCLSRNSDKLERCEQLYIIITKFANHDKEEEEFCSGQCPALLISSRDLCAVSSQFAQIMEVCPTYAVMPSTSIDIRANYSGQNCLEFSRLCSGCIWSRSGELTRCHQLYLLSQYANMSQIYSKAFCASNCPVRMATSNWYCNRNAELIFLSCQRRDVDTYCGPLLRDNGVELNGAVQACRANCTSQLCNSGKKMFGCCLRRSLTQQQCPEISSCILETSAATTSFIAASLIVLTSTAAHFLINFQ